MATFFLQLIVGRLRELTHDVHELQLDVKVLQKLHPPPEEETEP